MAKFIDLTGQKFGRLIVIERVPSPIHVKNKYDIYYKCKCECNNNKIISGSNLKLNKIRSCGCFKSEKISKLKKKYNKYDLTGEYGIGYTSKGEEFYFDLENYNLIKNYYWKIDDKGYIISDIYKNGNIKLHRLVMNVINKTNIIDHIFHDRKDSRKENLRIVTQQQNSFNCKLNKKNISGVTGVNFLKNNNRWRAYITFNYKQINLGCYINKEDAIKARKEAEVKYFGEFRYKGDD